MPLRVAFRWSLPHFDFGILSGRRPNLVQFAPEWTTVVQGDVPFGDGDIDLDLAEYRRMDDTQALARLAREPTDAFGLLVLYQIYKVDLRQAVIQYMRVDPKVYRRAIINVLLGVARHASQYDPEAMDAPQWVRCTAGAEARRLRQVLDDRH